MHKINPKFLRPLLKKRETISHKGDYGHLLLIGGCQSMPGAAVLATGAALKSGCGLVTLHSTARAVQAAVSAFPSAMLSEDGGECFSRVPDGLLRFTAIAVGPGLGRTAQAEETFASLLTRVKEQESPIPMVLDADALFILAAHPELMKLIPAGSVMTPHEVELRRLISWNTPEEKELELKTLCKETGCVVVAKSHLTEIYTPEGEKYVNTTGNAGLAKGGSGDVLTGLVGGLLARGYSALEAAALGVWIHGRAADALTAKYTAEAYSSRDLIDALYYGFKALE